LSLEETIISALSHPTYIGVGAVVVATCFGLPVPEEICLVLAGAAAYQGAFNLAAVLLVAAGAIAVGDFVIYLLGRYWGPTLFKWRFFRVILSPRKARVVRRRYAGHVLRAVFTVRFLSGLRTATYFTAGMVKLKPHHFLLSDLPAIAIYVPAWSLAGYFFSPHVARIISFLKTANHAVAVTAALGVVIIAGYFGYRVGLRRRPGRDEED